MAAVPSGPSLDSTPHCAQPTTWGVQVSVIISPSDKWAQLYPQALGSVFVAFYDFKSYGGGILTHLHTETCNNLNVIKSRTIVWRDTWRAWRKWKIKKGRLIANSK
jgi:hypothetical protein